MNLDRFILEVPVELRMRRKQRKKDDIINLAVLLPKNCVHDKGADILEEENSSMDPVSLHDAVTGWMRKKQQYSCDRNLL